MLKSWSSLIGLCFVAALACFIVRGIYNKCFHPLRHIPGPFWGGFTDFYKLRLVFGTHLPTFNLELHVKYGPVVRVSPNMVSISDPSMLPIVYQRRIDKSDFYSHGALGESPPNVQTRDCREHAAKRRLIAPVLAFKNVRACEPMFDEKIVELQTAISRTISESTERFDFSLWVRWFLMDSIVHAIFGKSGGFVKEGRDIDNMITGVSREMGPLALALGSFPWIMNPLLSIPFIRKRLIPRSGERWGSSRMMSFRDQLIQERLQSVKLGQKDEKISNDLLSIMLQIQSRNPQILSNSLIESECIMLMVAAFESTSGVICPLVHNIVREEDVHKRLLAEIDEFQNAGLLSSSVASYDETSAMPWFMACVQETLRFNPPIPITLPRIAPSGGLDLDGIYIPAGSEVGANAFVINRDRTIFGADADLFRPERWLRDPARAKKMDETLFTFGHGSRACLGKRYAKMEIQKLAIHLFRNFTFVLESSNEPWSVHRDRGFAHYRKQWLQVKDRRST